MKALSHAAHRRPYQKWEGLSVIVLTVVALIAVLVGHRGSSDHESSPTTTAGQQSDAETPTSAPPTEPITSSPVNDDSMFDLVKSTSTNFKGTKLNTRQWDVYEGVGNEGVGKREPSAISVDNGLAINAKGDVSGGISQKVGQTYGRFVIRASMDKGAGYGPAILLWPDSEKWPQDGEIDIVEIPKGDRSQAVMTTHYGNDDKQKDHGVPGDFSTLHTYAMDWLPDSLTFYIDGVVQYRVTDKAAIPTTPHHLAIQNDVGACGSFIGCRDAQTPATVALHVSSVRVYAYNGSGPKAP